MPSEAELKIQLGQLKWQLTGTVAQYGTFWRNLTREITDARLYAREEIEFLTGAYNSEMKQRKSFATVLTEIRDRGCETEKITGATCASHSFTKSCPPCTAREALARGTV